MKRILIALVASTVFGAGMQAAQITFINNADEKVNVSVVDVNGTGQAKDIPSSRTSPGKKSMFNFIIQDGRDISHPYKGKQFIFWKLIYYF